MRAHDAQSAHTRRELLLTHLERSPGGVVVLCDHAERRSTARSLRLEGCLATVDAHWLVDIAVAAGTAWLDVEQCPAAQARQQLWQLGELLGPRRLVVNALPEDAARGPLLDERRPPVDRRAALGLSALGLPTPGRPALGRPALGRPPVGLGRPETDGVQHSPGADPHTRLLESLANAGIVAAHLPSPALALGASGCTACGVCVRACPHDALRLTHSGSTSTLGHDAGACQGEGQCVELCPADALQTGGTLDWGAALERRTSVLARVPTRTCRRCQTRVPDDGQDLCPECTGRRRDPFGVHLPEELLARLGRGPDGRRL